MNVGLTGYEVAAVQIMRSSLCYSPSNSGYSGSHFTSTFNGTTGDLTINIANNHLLSNYPWNAGATVLLSKNGKYVVTDKLNICEASGLRTQTITFDSGYTGYTYVGLKSVDSFNCYQNYNSGDAGLPFTLSIDSNTGIISLTSLASYLGFLTQYPPSGFVFILAKD